MCVHLTLGFKGKTKIFYFSISGTYRPLTKLPFIRGDIWRSYPPKRTVSTSTKSNYLKKMGEIFFLWIGHTGCQKIRIFTLITKIATYLSDKMNPKKVILKKPLQALQKGENLLFCTFFAKTFSKWLFVIKICC